MNDESLEQLEQQIAAALPRGAGALRGNTLGAIERELRAARWDRRLGRAAAALVVLGVGLNGAIGWRGARDAEASLARGRASQASLVAAAAAVAEATDAETGRLVARQIAALGGWELSDEQAAAIDAAAAREDSGFGVRGSGVGG